MRIHVRIYSGSLFHFLHHYGIGDFWTFVSISHTFNCRYVPYLAKWLMLTRQCIFILNKPIIESQYLPLTPLTLLLLSVKCLFKVDNVVTFQQSTRFVTLHALLIEPVVLECSSPAASWPSDIHQHLQTILENSSFQQQFWLTVCHCYSVHLLVFFRSVTRFRDSLCLASVFKCLFTYLLTYLQWTVEREIHTTAAVASSLQCHVHHMHVCSCVVMQRNFQIV